jgi:hypothetical protein
MTHIKLVREIVIETKQIEMIEKYWQYHVNKRRFCC